MGPNFCYLLPSCVEASKEIQLKPGKLILCFSVFPCGVTCCAYVISMLFKVPAFFNIFFLLESNLFSDQESCAAIT